MYNMVWRTINDIARVRFTDMKLKCVSHIVLIQQIFLILLCIKVDKGHMWNWFLLFTPVWIINALLFIPLVYETFLIVRSRSEDGRANSPPKVKTPLFVVLYLGLLVSKLAAEILICLKKGTYPDLSWYYVFFPMIISLFGLLLGSVYITYCDMLTVRRWTVQLTFQGTFHQSSLLLGCGLRVIIIWRLCTFLRCSAMISE